MCISVKYFNSDDCESIQSADCVNKFVIANLKNTQAVEYFEHGVEISHDQSNDVSLNIGYAS